MARAWACGLGRGGGMRERVKCPPFAAPSQGTWVHRGLARTSMTWSCDKPPREHWLLIGSKLWNVSDCCEQFSSHPPPALPSPITLFQAPACDVPPSPAPLHAQLALQHPRLSRSGDAGVECPLDTGVE